MIKNPDYSEDLKEIRHAVAEEIAANQRQSKQKISGEPILLFAERIIKEMYERGWVKPISRDQATAFLSDKLYAMEEDLGWLATDICQTAHNSSTNAQAVESIKRQIKEWQNSKFEKL